MSDLPKAKDPHVERIASGLLRYLEDTCMTRMTGKMAICDALYEMKAITCGKRYHPSVEINGVPVHHSGTEPTEIPVATAGPA